MSQSISLQFDAVLPLVRKDWPRVDRVLLPTLSAYATGLQTIWMIVPKEDYTVARRHFKDPSIELLAETDLVPELADFQFSRNKLGEYPRGWFIQQLLKLAASRLVATDWYFTLDGDCLLGRTLRKSDVIRDGKLIAHIDSTSGFGYWYKWAERVLELKWPGRFFGVTPAPLHRQSVLDLFDYLRYKHGDDAERVLLKSFPWTEYALYYTFLEATGRFDQVHVGLEGSIYSNCVWEAEFSPASSWDPGPSFNGKGRPFTVLQSTQVDLETLDELVERIRSWFAVNSQISPI